MLRPPRSQKRTWLVTVGRNIKRLRASGQRVVPPCAGLPASSSSIHRITYNPSVLNPKPFTSHSLPLRARIAAFLGFLAVLAALLAPVSMLARDVQTGKFGGICSAGMSFAGVSGASDASGAGDDAQPSSHCDLCGATALVLPALQVPQIPCFAGTQVAQSDLPTNVGSAIPGLPFSRGPPVL